MRRSIHREFGDFRLEAYLVNKRPVKILEYAFTIILVLNKNALKYNVSSFG